MTILRYLVLVGVSGALSGCLMQRTVEQGGAVVSQGYVVKSPLTPPPPVP